MSQILTEYDDFSLIGPFHKDILVNGKKFQILLKNQYFIGRRSIDKSEYLIFKKSNITSKLKQQLMVCIATPGGNQFLEDEMHMFMNDSYYLVDVNYIDCDNILIFDICDILLHCQPSDISRTGMTYSPMIILVLDKISRNLDDEKEFLNNVPIFPKELSNIIIQYFDDSIKIEK